MWVHVRGRGVKADQGESEFLIRSLQFCFVLLKRMLHQYLGHSYAGQSRVNLTQKTGLALGPQSPFCPWFVQRGKNLIPGELWVWLQLKRRNGDQGQLQLGG